MAMPLLRAALTFAAATLARERNAIPAPAQEKTVSHLFPLVGAETAKLTPHWSWTPRIVRASSLHEEPPSQSSRFHIGTQFLTVSMQNWAASNASRVKFDSTVMRGSPRVAISTGRGSAPGSVRRCDYPTSAPYPSSCVARRLESRPRADRIAAPRS